MRYYQLVRLDDFIARFDDLSTHGKKELMRVIEEKLFVFILDGEMLVNDEEFDLLCLHRTEDRVPPIQTPRYISDGGHDGEL